MLTLYDIARLIDNYLSFELQYTEKKSRYAYKAQKPTYFMGLFKGYYQLTYAIVDLDFDTMQEVIDYAHDEMEYMVSRFGARLTLEKYYYGYYCAMKRFIRFMDTIKDRYYAEDDYTLDNVMSCIETLDILRCNGFVF